MWWLVSLPAGLVLAGGLSRMRLPWPVAPVRIPVPAGSPLGGTGRGRRAAPTLLVRALVVEALVVLVVLVAAAPAASAHEGEADEPASDLVLTAVAVLEAHPSGTELVEDKINDALESTEPGDVNLDLVRRAGTALAAGDERETLLLLEQAVGACPGAPVIYVPPGPRKPGPSQPCPTPTYVRGVASPSVGDTAGPALLAGAAVAAVLGGYVLVRVR